MIEKHRVVELETGSKRLAIELNQRVDQLDVDAWEQVAGAQRGSCPAARIHHTLYTYEIRTCMYSMCGWEYIENTLNHTRTNE